MSDLSKSLIGKKKAEVKPDDSKESNQEAELLNKIKELEKEVKTHQESTKLLDKKNQEIVDLNEDLKEANRKVVDNGYKIDELQKDLKEVNDEFAKQCYKIEDLNKIITDLEKSIKDRDDLEKSLKDNIIFDEKDNRLAVFEKQLKEKNAIIAGFGVDIEDKSNVSAICTMLDNISNITKSERMSIIGGALKGRLLSLKYDDDTMNKLIDSLGSELDKEAIEGRVHAMKVVAQTEIKA